MKANSFTCRTHGNTPEPCGCEGPTECTDCRRQGDYLEIEPGVYICPGCVDSYRRQTGAAA